jgi:hypothetical protein
VPGDNVVTLHPPIQYSIIWLIIGCILLLLIGIWYGVMFWITRKRKPKTIEQLPPAPTDFDLDRLKAKYLQLIDECYQNYQVHKTDLKGLHRGLSMTARYFVYEARHFPAPRLTLADLKYAPFPELTKVVEEYYAKEFAAVENGTATQAVKAAKDFVNRWV